MQKYPVRAAVRTRLSPESLEALCRTHFETVRRDDGTVTASFGAIRELAVHLDGKEIAVNVQMNPDVPGPVQQETIRRYNRFLEEATGFSAKERSKRLRKSAAGD